MNELGDFLKKLRGDLSLREVQEGTGISHTYLSTLEKGYDPRTKKERKPTPEVLRKLARFYKVRYKDLMFLAGYLEIDTDQNDSLTYEERATKIKEYTLKTRELDKQIEELKETPKKQEKKISDFILRKEIKYQSLTQDKKVFDLFVLLSMDVDLFYKNRLLTIDEREKIKTILKTFFE
ncbi:helix-turn-helix transcriptional regulator [Neobacillus drentensis]|uniref:helix-turn-helix domain-containing protein n=1 Tax=Neobacillus drentensis TaxID=220684 RepID=UPI002FFF942E